jgi:hypothetical protein
MTTAFSWIEYLHWLIIVGAVLLTLGFVGFASRRPSVEAESPDITNDPEPSEPEDDLTQVEAYYRAAKERRRARWVERVLKESANDTPSIFGGELK